MACDLSARSIFRRRLRGDSPPRETAREDADGTAEDGAGGVRGDLSYCWDARGNGDGRTAATISGDHESRITDDTTCVVQPLMRMRRGRDKTHGLEYRRDGTANALITPNGGRGGIGVGAVACVADAHPLTVGAVTRKWAKGTGGPSGDECQNLIVVHGSQDPDISLNITHPIGRNNGQESVILTRRSESVPETASTLTGITGRALTTRAPNVIVQPCALAIRGRGEAVDLEYRQDDTANAIVTPNGGRGGIGAAADSLLTDVMPKADGAFTLRPTPVGGGQPQFVVHDLTVRRLTPRECERLQGFPDDYTRIEWRRKRAADTPRYKALGNSMAVPVMRWIGQKIDDALVYQATASEPQRKLPDCLYAAAGSGAGGSVSELIGKLFSDIG